MLGGLVGQIWGQRVHIWGRQGIYGVKGAAFGELGGTYRIRGPTFGAIGGLGGEIWGQRTALGALVGPGGKI